MTSGEERSKAVSSLLMYLKKPKKKKGGGLERQTEREIGQEVHSTKDTRSAAMYLSQDSPEDRGSGKN